MLKRYLFLSAIWAFVMFFLVLHSKGITLHSMGEKMKKKTIGLLICVLSFVAVSSKAETIIPGGDVFGSWGLPGSPYLIDGEITVPTDSTLRIEQGVDVIFLGHYKLIVNGHLIAIGTETDSILFTAADTSYGWHGIRFINTTDSSYLVFCIIQYARAYGNTPDSYGGGIFCDHSNSFISNSLIRKNSCGVSDDGYYYGGGICCLYSGLTIRNCIIMQNRTEGTYSGGGGIFLEHSVLTIDNCIIVDNIASYTAGAIFSSSSNIWITHSSISENMSGNDAGGIAIFFSTSTIQNCIISNNTADAEAGGIYFQSSNSIISYCRITGNSANADGGGIHLYNDYSTTVSHCTISRNSALIGGGISITYYQPPEDSPVSVVNTIVEGNNGNGGIRFLNSPGVQIAFCDFSNNQNGNFTGTPPINLGQIVTTNLNGDSCDQFYNIFLEPLFVDPLADIYCLQAASPCIDAGDPNSPLDPDTTIADIGAFYFDQETFRGDANADGMINVVDVVYLINFLFIDGPAPVPIQAGDVNCSGRSLFNQLSFHRWTATKLLTVLKLFICQRPSRISNSEVRLLLFPSHDALALGNADAFLPRQSPLPRHHKGYERKARDLIPL